MFIGKDPALLEVVNAASIVAVTDVTTLVLGESGTGKELLAQVLHQKSGRAENPFVSVNCAALPESLAESLLFGHQKSAFTGATSDHAGYIRSADGGSLFLDEVAELPSSVQSKLLRFLESGEILPLGAERPVKVNVRIIAATHKDLFAEVKQGAFREDLYYRLYVVPLQLPALRDRPGDIKRLLLHFMAEFSNRYELATACFSNEALSQLKAHHWPGNIRELRNLCERLAVLLPGKAIRPENLPAEFTDNRVRQESSAWTLPAGGLVLADLEKDLIRQALARTGGNRSRAARLLGLTRDTLLYRLKKFALE